METRRDLVGEDLYAAILLVVGLPYRGLYTYPWVKEVESVIMAAGGDMDTRTLVYTRYGFCHWLDTKQGEVRRAGY